MKVDLVITSAQPYLTMTIKGTKGSCVFPRTGRPPWYTIAAADFPQLGPGGFLQAYGATVVPGGGTVPPNLQALINGVGIVSPISGNGVTVRPDQQVVKLDADASGGRGGSSVDNLQGADTTVSAHITGTLTCG